MQKYINQITTRWLATIQENLSIHSFESLLESGIPAFAVEYARFILGDIISDELSYPNSEWFNNEDEKVKIQWNEYVEAAQNSAHIPSQNLSDLLNSTVSDLLLILTEPQINIPELLFQDNDELSPADIQKRCKRLTVFQHYGQAIPLYIKKKELKTLSKTKCRQVIQNLDAKLFAGHKPKEWGNLLSPLFELHADNVPASLLNLFFNDKQLTEKAELFSADEELFDRNDFKTRLIENKIPESVATENVAEEVEEEIVEGTDVTPVEKEEVKNIVSNFDETVEKEQDIQPNNTLAGRFQTKKEVEEDEPEETVPNSLNTKFQKEKPKEESVDEESIQEDTPEEVITEEDDEVLETFIPSAPLDETAVDDFEMSDVFEDEADTSIDLNSDLPALESHLSDSKKKFIKKIFRNSKNEYLEALADLAEMKDWDSASKFIQEDIFTKNNIDLLSEDSINFTDKLHQFFKER